VWFADDSHPGSNQGTLANPFVGLTAGNLAGAGGAGDVDGPGDILFLFAGSYTSGIDLEQDQQLIGQGSGLVIDGQSIVPASTAPVLTNAAGNGVVLAQDNSVTGLTVGDTAGVGITGSSFGTLTVSNVTLGGTGGALDLTNGTLAATFVSISSTNSGGRGVNLDAVTGSLAVPGGTTVTDSALAGIRVVNGGSDYSFGATTLSSTGSGLELSNNATSTFEFASLAVTTDAGPGLLAAASGTLAIGGVANTIVATGGPALDVTSTSFGAGATFSMLSSSGSPGKGLNLDAVSGSLVATGGSISGASGVAFDVNAGSSTLTFGGSISNAGGRAVEVTGRSGGTLTLSGVIADSGSGINVANNSGGTITLSGTYSGTAATSQIDVTGNSGSALVSFSGASKVLSTGSSNAIDVTGNGSATVNFTGGGLAITTTSGIGFNATGGAGGVTVQGANNTISSTAGIALNVANTTIGSSGLTFQSISAGTAAGSSGVGINLDSTGGSGGLRVTGNGGAGSGGTIQHKTGADFSTTSGIGMFLRNTSDVELNWMQLNHFDNSAIVGRNVDGFILNDSVIDGVIGTNSVPIEGAIMFGLYLASTENPAGENGLQGTGLIHDTRISGSVEHNLEFYNNSGSMDLTIEGSSDVGATSADCEIKSNSIASGSDGVQVETRGGVQAITIRRCLFDDNKSQAVQASSLGTSQMTVTIDRSRILRTTQGNEGFILSNGADGDLTAFLTDNSISGLGGAAVFVGQAPGNATNQTDLRATITGNSITAPSTATNHALIAYFSATTGMVAPARVLISGNTVFQNSTTGVARGIIVDTPDSGRTPDFDVTVTNNSVAVADDVAGVSGIAVQSRNTATGCASIGGNTVTFPNGTPGGVVGLRARQATLAVLDIEGSSSPSCTGTAAAVLACRNPSSTTEVLGTVGTVSQGTCLLP
jgi:hypothetical protein